MSISSNTAQTRELSELRNHLKWLDEERRKSGRKMAELEQRLAQQGRELADRDQKIQDLEWHVANFAERFERLPDLDTNVAGTEQRLQDLEWHLSNMNTQLTRMPNMEEERARMMEEASRIVTTSQERQEAGLSLLESRLRSEMVALRESDEHRALSIRQDEQSQTLHGLEQQIVAVQESVGMLSGQLRERTVNLAAESQAGISSLAARLQEHLEAMAAEQEATFNAWFAEQQTALNAISAEQQGTLSTISAEQQAALSTISVEQQAALSTISVEQQAALSTISVEQQARLDAFAAEWQNRLDHLPLPSNDPSPELLLHNERLAGLEQTQQQWQLRLTQLEEGIGKLGNVREIMPILDRLEQELELRQAEEVRLSNLLGTQENRFAPLADALEEMNGTTNTLHSRVSDSERLLEELRVSIQDFNDNWKPALSETSRRIAPLTERITVLSNNVLKTEAGLQTLTGDQSELREMMTGLTDDARRNQSDVARQLEGWQATLDENKDTIERFTQQWLTLSNQYKEARMAVQNFAHWQKQLEQQKREASEMLRIESNRMQSRWDGFLLEIQEKLKNFELELGQKWQAFELENEQKWSSARRNEQIRREELAAVDELIQKLQQDNRNLIWRVQAAQADAIKKWPRLLMEEVEKAVELNPNRRLASTGAAPRTDMSVVDAIEQGLITIDYNDDSALDI